MANRKIEATELSMKNGRDFYIKSEGKHDYIMCKGSNEHYILLNDVIGCLQIKNKLELIKGYSYGIALVVVEFADEESACRVETLVQLGLLKKYKAQLIEPNKATGEAAFYIKDDYLYTNQNFPICLNLVQRYAKRNGEFLVSTDSLNYKYVSFDEVVLDSINNLVREYFKKKKLVDIFKDIQKNNPMLSVDETWFKANQTYSLLDKNDLLLQY